MTLAPPRSAPISDNLKASLLMVASMGAFATNDAMVKFATQSIPPSQVMAVRGVMATLLLLLIARAQGALRPIPREALRPIALRALADMGATITFISALATLPLANASAILQALPLTITVAAVLFLGERPGWRRWISIAAGFVGVLLIVRPGTEGFTLHSLSVLACVAFCAFRDIVTRSVPRGTPSVLVSSVTAMAVSVFGFALLPFQGWQPMDATMVLGLAVAALAIATGYLGIVTCMRIGEVGFVAPFRYTSLLFSVLLGIALFGERPAALDLIGGAIVVASGAYMIYRERRIGRTNPARVKVP